MFGLFGATCPCDPAAKKWVEERLEWLAGQFGLHILLERPIVLPTDEFFPDSYDGSPKSVQKLFHRVCAYMKVDPAGIELELFNDRTSATAGMIGPWAGIAAGTWTRGDGDWTKSVVRLERAMLDRPSDVIGVMAHELSHQHLLGEGRIHRSAFDNELLTDLTAAFHGFGVFLANNPRKSTGKLLKWPGTDLNRPEYLSEPMLGYAMAHIAWFRDEHRPAWAKHLRWSQRAVFKQGLRYLQKTADSTFRPVRLRGARIDRETVFQRSPPRKQGIALQTFFEGARCPSKGSLFKRFSKEPAAQARDRSSNDFRRSPLRKQGIALRACGTACRLVCAGHPVTENDGRQPVPITPFGFPNQDCHCLPAFGNLDPFPCASPGR